MGGASGRDVPDAGAEASSEKAPKLKVMAPEELVGFVKAPHAKLNEKQKPSQAAVTGAQTSFERLGPRAQEPWAAAQGEAQEGALQLLPDGCIESVARCASLPR